MADIKWIKITTDIFDDEKMKIIDTMPARDEIIVIWFKLLSLAGKVNQNGLLYMSNKISYTPEMLSAIFNRPLNTVTLALGTFENFGMIELEDDNTIGIANWEKHQNVDGMAKIREQNRLRQIKHRESKKLLESNVTLTLSNATDKDKEEKKIKKKSKDITYYACEDLPYFNDPSFKETWSAWMDVRKKKKTILSEYSMKKIYNQLSKWCGADMDMAISVIDKSILGNYPNIYEPNRSFSSGVTKIDKFKGKVNFEL